ncbi:alkene reductase [Amycolatopsis sp.]|uniref:oxidoreductase n=1 Tax=Amycolatopsis sp. TaxID=37632 RepID=UPI002BEF0F09|nr:alkene reductase [Amycolatopsis sp.]HVV11326.1 alkene reductase [Amycolatopsis sp.]
MTTLFDSFPLGGLTLPNRTVMAPMTRVRAAAGGPATPSMATYYAQRATAGLIVSEGVQPSSAGQSNPGTPGLHTGEQTESWGQVTAVVHANGGRIFAQLMHGGRVSHPATTGCGRWGCPPWRRVHPRRTTAGPAPAGIGNRAQAYADAARRAVDAGLDGVELHGANGYLISQFLSSNTNLRTDRYGGPVPNRIRFAVEAVSATVAAIGAERTGIRLSPGGTFWGVEETDVPELLTELASLEIAYIHVEATAGEEVLLGLRRQWPGALIMNPVLPMGPKQTGRADADRWLGLGADLISFGRRSSPTPISSNACAPACRSPPVDETRYHQGAAAGDLTYPAYQHTA